MFAPCFRGKWRSCPVVFCENLWATYAREASVDMDMDMDGKFHIHGKPE